MIFFCFRSNKFLCPHRNVQSLLGNFLKAGKTLVEEIHYTIAVGSVFPNSVPFFTTCLGEKLWLPKMASSSNDTTKSFHDRSFRRLLLQNLREEKAHQSRRAKWSF